MKYAVLDKKKLFKSLKETGGRAAWFLARHAFFVLLILMLASILMGEYIFYKYGVLAVNYVPDSVVNPNRFREQTYQSVLKSYQERQEKFESSAQSVPQNPFQ